MVAEVSDVAMTERDGAEFLGQRLHALFQRIALPGKGKFRPLVAAGFRNSVGNRPVVGDPQDHTALTAHQAHIFSHLAHVHSRRNVRTS